MTEPTKTENLRSFLHREGNGRFSLYFCRGKRCPMNNPQLRRLKCTDCVRGKDKETLGEVIDKIERGDA